MYASHPPRFTYQHAAARVITVPVQLGRLVIVPLTRRRVSCSRLPPSSPSLARPPEIPFVSIVVVITDDAPHPLSSACAYAYPATRNRFGGTNPLKPQGLMHSSPSSRAWRGARDGASLYADA